MKQLSVFETSIIGFFIGVIASTYLLFVTSTNGFIGEILGWISLRPVFLNYIHLPDNQLWYASFFFYILVFTIYGLIIGFIIKAGKKAVYSVFAISILIIIGVFFEQKKGSSSLANIPAIEYPEVATVIKTIQREPQQYFGNEVKGDLNNDGKNDIAFLITRNDKDRGILYYLASSLATDNGYIGTNLVYIGEKIQPQNISIDNGVISIDYLNLLNKNSTTTERFSAQLINGELIATSTKSALSQ